MRARSLLQTIGLLFLTCSMTLSAAASPARNKTSYELAERAGTSSAHAEANELDTIVAEFMEENNLSADNFSLSYYNTVTGETYFFNETKMMDAASTYKLPLNMYYYELQARGEVSGSDYFGGTTLNNCHMQSIVWSNNELSQVLRRNLGSYDTYKHLMRQYTTMPESEVDPVFYTRNRYCTRMMLEILQYLYDRQTEFAELIGYMKEAMPGAYFKKYIDDCEIAHKYGSNQGAENDVGIFYTEQPFLLAVYTQNVGMEIVSEAAVLFKDYNEAGSAELARQAQILEGEHQRARAHQSTLNLLTLALDSAADIPAPEPVSAEPQAEEAAIPRTPIYCIAAASALLLGTSALVFRKRARSTV